MDKNSEKPATKSTKGYYGKRPLWQWILLYIVLGGIIYFLVYWFFLRHSGSSSTNPYSY